MNAHDARRKELEAWRRELIEAAELAIEAAMAKSANPVVVARRLRDDLERIREGCER